MGPSSKHGKRRAITIREIIACTKRKRKHQQARETIITMYISICTNLDYATWHTDTHCYNPNNWIYLYQSKEKKIVKRRNNN